MDLIQDDWAVFSERLVEGGGAGPLIESIMHCGWDDDDGEPPLHASDPYVARHRTWSHDTLADVWEEFAERVKEDPTRELEFRDPEFDDFLVGEDLLGRRTVHEPTGTVYYRARPGFGKDEDGRLLPYSGAGIGAPPPESAKAGRANPDGKVVMYCADQEATAVAEVRPAKGEYVSVAEVRANKELRILDLASEPEWPNPFTDEAVNYEVEFAALLAAFADELEKPLRRRDDPTDYIPSQKLTALIERAGIDGIRYPSAMYPGGKNIVLFDPKTTNIGDSSLVEVTDTAVLRANREGSGYRACREVAVRSMRTPVHVRSSGRAKLGLNEFATLSILRRSAVEPERLSRAGLSALQAICYGVGDLRLAFDE